MSCNGPEKKCEKTANAAGLPQVDAEWSAGRRAGEHCPKCGGWLTEAGGCNKCNGVGRKGEGEMPEMARKRAYFDAEIDRVDPAWLDGFKPSEGFSRQDGEKILESIRRGAIDKLSERRFESNEAMGRAVAAINANTLKHTAQVMVMATKIAAVTGADAQTTRTAGLAAGYHDSGKDDTNFVYHHLAGAEFAERALRATGLSEDDSEIAAVRQAIMEHMPFGDGSNPNNFMNAALCGEAAAIAKTSGQGWQMERVPNEIAMRLFDDVEKEFPGGGSLGTAVIDGVPVTFMRDGNSRMRKESVMYDTEARRKLRYLMVDALQKDGAAVERVEKWLADNAGKHKTQAELGKAMQAEFGGRELSYPRPSSDAARILSDAATASGEHLGEVRRGNNGRSLLEASYTPSEITWAADGLMLSSAESLGKIVDIHQKQWGRAGTEPIIVSMASLCGGAYGQRGTAVDAAEAMQIPLVKQTARQEIGLMREYMGHWQGRTFENWARGKPSAEVEARRQRLGDNPFTAFEADEMLRYQPPIEDFHREYPEFLRRNNIKRGVIHRMN